MIIHYHKFIYKVRVLCWEMKLSEILNLNTLRYIVFYYDFSKKTFVIEGEHRTKKKTRQITESMRNDDEHPLYVVKKGRFYEPHLLYDS